MNFTETDSCVIAGSTRCSQLDGAKALHGRCCLNQSTQARGLSQTRARDNEYGIETQRVGLKLKTPYR